MFLYPFNRALSCIVPADLCIICSMHQISDATATVGVSSSFPVWVAPMAMHGLAHQVREIGTAKGAAAVGVPYVSLGRISTTCVNLAAKSHSAVCIKCSSKWSTDGMAMPWTECPN